MTIIERVSIIIDDKKLSRTAFSKLIGMPQTTVNNYILGIRSIPFEFVKNILDSFPDISAEWLMRGEGEMLKQSNIYQDEDSSQKNTGQDAEYWKHVALSNMEIMTLHVDELNSRIKELEAEILNLKSNGSMELSSSANPA